MARHLRKRTSRRSLTTRRSATESPYLPASPSFASLRRTSSRTAVHRRSGPSLHHQLLDDFQRSIADSAVDDHVSEYDSEDTLDDLVDAAGTEPTVQGIPTVLGGYPIQYGTEGLMNNAFDYMGEEPTQYNSGIANRPYGELEAEYYTGMSSAPRTFSEEAENLQRRLFELSDEEDTAASSPSANLPGPYIPGINTPYSPQPSIPPLRPSSDSYHHGIDTPWSPPLPPQQDEQPSSLPDSEDEDDLNLTAELRDTFEALAAERNSALAQIQDLLQQVHDANAEVDVHRSNLEESVAVRERLEQRVFNLEQEAESDGDRLQEMLENRAETVDVIDLLQDEITQLNSDLAQARGEQAGDQQHTQSQDLDESLSLANAAVALLENCEERKGELEAETAGLQAEIEVLRAENSLLHAQVEDFEDRFEQAEDESVDTHLAADRAPFNASGRDYREPVDQGRGENQRRQYWRDQSSSPTANRVQRQRTNLARRLGEADKEVDRLQRENDQLRQDLDDCRSGGADSLARISALQEQYDDMKRALEERDEAISRESRFQHQVQHVHEMRAARDSAGASRKPSGGNGRESSGSNARKRQRTTTDAGDDNTARQQQEIDRLKQELEECRKHRKANDNASQQKKEIDRLKEELEEYKRKFQECSDHRYEQANQLREIHDQFEKDRRYLTKENKEQAKDLAEVKKRLQNCERHKSLANRKGSEDEKDKKIGQLEEELQRVSNSLDECRNERTKGVVKRIEPAGCLGQLTVLREELKACRKHGAEADKKIEELEGQLVERQDAGRDVRERRGRLPPPQSSSSSDSEDSGEEATPASFPAAPSTVARGRRPAIECRSRSPTRSPPVSRGGRGRGGRGRGGRGRGGRGNHPTPPSRAPTCSRGRVRGRGAASSTAQPTRQTRSATRANGTPLNPGLRK